jgi:hypothetical protein
MNASTFSVQVPMRRWSSTLIANGSVAIRLFR